MRDLDREAAALYGGGGSLSIVENSRIDARIGVPSHQQRATSSILNAVLEERPEQRVSNPVPGLPRGSETLRLFVGRPIGRIVQNKTLERGETPWVVFAVPEALPQRLGLRGLFAN